MSEYWLTDIYIYPIKSLGGIRLDQCLIEQKGLQYDRQWMLIDQSGTFVSQRKHHLLSLLQVEINGSELTVAHKLKPELSITFDKDCETGELIQVTVWDDQCNGMEVSKTVNDWFSSLLGMNVRLVKMLNEEERFVDPRYAHEKEVVRFSDGYPCLIIGQAALDQLNQKLDQTILMDRFRPNFVFSGGRPHEEDTFSTFEIGGVAFSAVKPCARCVLITVDQQTGKKGSEPLKTLASYRSRNNKIMFGQNLIHNGSGIITTNTPIVVHSYKTPV